MKLWVPILVNTNRTLPYELKYDKELCNYFFYALLLLSILIVNTDCFFVHQLF